MRTLREFDLPTRRDVATLAVIADRDRDGLRSARADALRARKDSD